MCAVLRTLPDPSLLLLSWWLWVSPSLNMSYLKAGILLSCVLFL